ncbi:MAG: asparagine synthase-related protein [Bradymonadaceae bacterium]
MGTLSDDIIVVVRGDDVEVGGGVSGTPGTASDRRDARDGVAPNSAPENEMTLRTDIRDVHPTYIGRSGETTVVARSARASAKALDDATLDPETVASRLGDWQRDPQRTLFREVQRLPAGMSVTVDPSTGELSVKPVETSPWHDPDVAAGSEEDEARFRDLLSDQLRSLAEGASRLDVGLSGGLDSSAIVATLAESGAEAVVWRLDDGCNARDEGGYADALVERYALEEHRVEVAPVDLPDHFAATVRHADGPVINPRAVSKYVFFRQVAEADGGTFVSGFGADEVFAGKPNAWEVGLDGVPGFAAGGRDARRIGRSVLREGADPARRRPAGATTPCGRDGVRDDFSRLRALGFETVTRDLLLPMEVALPRSLGIAIATPYLAPAMVRFGLSLGRDDLIEDGVGKVLVRRAMAPVVGDEIAWQDKEAVLQPPGGGDAAIRDRWVDLFDGWLTRTRFECLEAVDPESVAELLETYAGMAPTADRFADVERVLMRLASIVIAVDGVVST